MCICVHVCVHMSVLVCECASICVHVCVCVCSLVVVTSGPGSFLSKPSAAFQLPPKSRSSKVRTEASGSCVFGVDIFSFLPVVFDVVACFVSFTQTVHEYLV